jgi:4-amino-4-deoxy-L-arabinose transferase-like glycosyltransferase
VALWQPTIAWAAALIVVAAVLAGTGYRTRDPDSRAYIRISTELADRPAATWIAPQWWGAWGMQGLFREHPAGTFLAPALMTRAGYPAAQAPFVVSLACQVGSLLLLAALAARVIPRLDARLLVWALQLLPIAFVFRVRANQEYLVLLGLVAAIYGTERARDRAGWIAMALLGFGWALLVKGVFAMLAPVVCALWLWVRRREPAHNSWQAWLAPALMLLLAPVMAIGYEQWYASVTGESFLDYYLGPRIALEGSAASGTLPFPLDKAWNALWYAGRVAWYAAPWSLALAAGALADRRRLSSARGEAGWRRYAWLATTATIVLVAARDIKADRYVFPAYFFAAAGGVVVAVSFWPRLSRLASMLDRSWPWGPVVLWLVLVVGRILLG